MKLTFVSDIALLLLVLGLHFAAADLPVHCIRTQVGLTSTITHHFVLT